MLKDQVRILRKRNKLSQRELAELSGFHQSQISKIENGNRKKFSDAELEYIATALKVSKSELLSEPQVESAEIHTITA